MPICVVLSYPTKDITLDKYCIQVLMIMSLLRLFKIKMNIQSEANRDNSLLVFLQYGKIVVITSIVLVLRGREKLAR